MRNIILCDNSNVWAEMLPLTFTRPVSHLLTGASTLKERWMRLLPGEYSVLTEPHLAELFSVKEAPDGDNLIITSHIIPSSELAAEIEGLEAGEALMAADGTEIARRGPLNAAAEKRTTAKTEPLKLNHIYDLFMMCGEFIADDFAHFSAGRESAPLSDSCTLIGPADRLFIEPGATVEGAVINVTKGPVYIGRQAEVMEGACLRGPIAIGEASTVNMGARIYGPTTLGAHCKVGGELNNVVMHPYSNKAHDGFLGNAVIGSWCNLGAGCTASNLKNDYTEIKLWNYPSRRFLRTGLQFCGLIMGDHSKAGINTMFNTATVTGVGVNIHGTGFPRNFVASFSEGSAAGFSEVPLSKFFKIAERVMARRGIELTEADRRMYTELLALTESYR